MKTKWMRRMALVMAGTMLLAGTAGCTKQAAPAAVDGGGSAKQGSESGRRKECGGNLLVQSGCGGDTGIDSELSGPLQGIWN